MASLNADLTRARTLATKLYTSFSTPGEGIFGNIDMPEDLLPAGVVQGSLEHLLFVTLTVTIDYMRDADELWRLAREAYADPDTRYLFEPGAIHEAGLSQATHDMKVTGLSRKPKRDPYYWHTVAVTFLKKWDGDPRNFLADCEYDGPTVLRRLRTDQHQMMGREVADYPYLKGPKISSLWIRMLRDNVGIKLSKLEEVPIPVDVHVLRATLCTGVLRGTYTGPVNELFKEVRKIWQVATQGVELPHGSREMIALDVDEPLWHLSRSGCTRRGSGKLGPCPSNCPARPNCVSGKIVISGTDCEVNT